MQTNMGLWDCKASGKLMMKLPAWPVTSSWRNATKLGLYVLPQQRTEGSNRCPIDCPDRADSISALPQIELNSSLNLHSLMHSDRSKCIKTGALHHVQCVCRIDWLHFQPKPCNSRATQPLDVISPPSTIWLPF